MAKIITLLKAAGHHGKGAVLRVWSGGAVEPDHVDAARAAQWLSDGVAEEFSRYADTEEEQGTAEPKKRTARKRGK